jgi:hypothetical protein
MPAEIVDAMKTGRPQYDKAWEALKDAHAACFNHPDRGPIGMSHGPFSGVNVARSEI